MIGARSRVPLLLAAVLLLALAFAPRAAGSIYWANVKGTTIGTANIDGTGVNQNFIIAGPNPCGVAVDGAHLYWGDSGDGTIGRSNLDGTGADQSFIGGATGPCGVAVDVPPSAASPMPPSNVFTLGKPKLNQRRGTAQLPVTVPGPGELGLSGNGVKVARAVRVNAARAQAPVQLLIAAMGAKRRRLNRTGKLTVRPTVTYTPDGGRPGIRSTKLRLVKR